MGIRQIIDLDSRPPDGFLETIASRSGVDLDTLRCMTLVGWVPWLLDSFYLNDEAYNCYVNQFSVLLHQDYHLMRIVPGWRAWLPKANLIRACPICLTEFCEIPVFKLVWQFPLIVSCPVHGCWLEPMMDYSDHCHSSVDEGLVPRKADQVITKMDRFIPSKLSQQVM